MGTWLTLAAFLVALAALYLSSLRAADIDVDEAEAQGESFEPPSFNGSNPSGSGDILIVAVYAMNAGAHGGVLERVRATRFEYLGEDPPYWNGVSAGLRTKWAPSSPPQDLPLAIEAGDVKTFFLNLRLSRVVRDGAPSEDFAQHLRGMSRIAITVEWTFVRTPLLAIDWRWVPKQFRRKRARVTRELRLEFDCQRYKDGILNHWRHLKDRHPLVELAGAPISV